MVIDTKIIPVIHKINNSQVRQNIEVCLKNGIDRVFLIDHAGVNKVGELIFSATNFKKEYKMWVGINPLGISTTDALTMDIDLDGLWCDGTASKQDFSFRKFKGQFFGGLAFKYQPQPADMELACENAILSTDVATTSGPGTGRAATIDKIMEIRHHLGKHPMAIASGVSVVNIPFYRGIVDYLLVASSITDKSELIIPEKLIELKAKLDEPLHI